MANNKVRIKFKSYDAKKLDDDIKNIISVVTRYGSRAIGPIPLPTKKKLFCVNRSPHVDKNSHSILKAVELDILGKLIQRSHIILVMLPAPIVLPPSLIANFKLFSIAILEINSTVMEALSPGIIISVPLGKEITPVTSVVLK